MATKLYEVPLLIYINVVYVFLSTQDLCAYQDNILSSNLFSESICCWIPLTNKDCLLFGLIYRLPNSDTGNFNTLCSLSTQAINTGVYYLLIAGDFNMPHINWNKLSVTSNSVCDGAFLTLLDDLLFTQHVTFPTRCIEIIKLHLYWILY